MGDLSVITAIRTNHWKHRQQHTLSSMAGIAVLFDVVTTYHALTADGYSEANLVLAKLAEIHVAIALLLHGGFAFSIVLITRHSFGWLSITSGWFAIVAFGGAGITNLLGYISGTSLSDLISVEPAIVPHAIFPLAGFVTGVFFAYRNYQKLPLREVVTVGTVLLTGTILPLLIV